MSSSIFRRGAVDAARLVMRYELRRQAFRALGEVDLLYERQATFQDLGRVFQSRGSWWVVESNGPFWYEAGEERKSLALVATAKRLELDAYRDADLVIAVSDALKEIIVRESGRADSDVYVLPNATDEARFDPARSLSQRSASSPVVGWVGYMTEWAGLDNLILAAGSLRRAGHDLRLVLVGDGPDRSRLEGIAMRERIADVVHFVGHVGWDDVPDLMSGFDVAFSGQREMRIGAMYHSPQKLYEYQSMGLPIVASDYPDARVLIEESKAGWLFRPNDVRSLQDAVAAALTTGDREERGRRARTNVLRNHTWSVRLETLLSELDRRGMRGTKRCLSA